MRNAKRLEFVLDSMASMACGCLVFFPIREQIRNPDGERYLPVLTVLALGLFASIWVQIRLYAPVERLVESAKRQKSQQTSDCPSATFRKLLLPDVLRTLLPVTAALLVLGCAELFADRQIGISLFAFGMIPALLSLGGALDMIQWNCRGQKLLLSLWPFIWPVATFMAYVLSIYHALVFLIGPCGVNHRGTTATCSLLVFFVASLFYAYWRWWEACKAYMRFVATPESPIDTPLGV